MIHVPQVFLGRSLSRRAVLRSALAGAGMLGLSVLPPWLARAASSSRVKKRSLMLLWQDGGPSHFETFDPKPDAPSEYRGELGAIPTTLPGVAFCEVLPRLARLAHRMCVIRSLRHKTIETTQKYYVDQDVDDVSAELWAHHESSERRGERGDFGPKATGEACGQQERKPLASKEL